MSSAALRAALRVGDQQFATQREVVLADGAVKVVPYVGPLELRFKNRAGFTGALVIGNKW